MSCKKHVNIQKKHKRASWDKQWLKWWEQESNRTYVPWMATPQQYHWAIYSSLLWQLPHNFKVYRGQHHTLRRWALHNWRVHTILAATVVALKRFSSPYQGWYWGHGLFLKLVFDTVYFEISFLKGSICQNFGG